jgi:hypothetical protein
VIAATGQRGREDETLSAPLLLLPLQKDRSKLTIERDIIFRCLSLGWANASIYYSAFNQHRASLEQRSEAEDALKLLLESEIAGRGNSRVRCQLFAEYANG